MLEKEKRMTGEEILKLLEKRRWVRKRHFVVGYEIAYKQTLGSTKLLPIRNDGKPLSATDLGNILKKIIRWCA